MDQLGSKILLMVGALALFVVLFVGVINPAIKDKGDEVKTEIGGTSTNTVGGN